MKTLNEKYAGKGSEKLAEDTVGAIESILLGIIEKNKPEGLDWTADYESFAFADLENQTERMNTINAEIENKKDSINQVCKAVAKAK